MATVKRRFFNPHNVLHNSIEVNTVRQVTLRRTWQRLADQGDNDITDSFQAKVNLQVNGSITIADAIQGDALVDAAEGTLQWDGRSSPGAQMKRVTVSGVSFFDVNETDSHNAIDNITIGWNAFSPTGADPVTVALIP